jgi:hypothetical protein
LGLFTATSCEAPLIPKLRGQLAEFLNNPSPVGLRILSSSTCVGLRYGHLSIQMSFSRLGASPTSLLNFAPLRPGQPTPGFSYLQVSLILKVRWSRNFYRVCIDYALRPRLSSRLTLGGRTFPKKPEIFGHYDSHIILATHSGILTSVQSTAASAATSPRTERSPTTALRQSKASVACLAPLYFPRRVTRPVIYYELF